MASKTFYSTLIVIMANQHILAPLVKCMCCAFRCVAGVPPHTVRPHKKVEVLIFLTKDMAHYVFPYKTIYVSIEISMLTHTYVHITQDMSTHKFQCPTEVVTLDKGNCKKNPAHIYIND